ncbi:MAG: hypothetical protein ACREO3_03075 [Arenimonas sp.]
MHPRLRATLFAVAAFALAAGVHAKDRPLFDTQAPLTVTLQAPWAGMAKNKQSQRYPAVLGYTDAQGQARRIDATVETRGITRKRVCKFPPLRLRMAPAAVAGSYFAGQDSLKMVTHCRTGEAYHQYYVQELLAYRIYNLLTEQSFRARTLDVTYIDTAGGKPDGPRFAFLIEDVGDMARRNDLKKDPRARFRRSDFDPAALSRFMLFQYLIGNTDWDVNSGPEADECCHNVRVVGAEGKGRIPVPYDFDSAGMIGAQYAVPSEVLPIKDVSQRLFRGFCDHNDALEVARRQFLDQRQAIFALVNGEPRLAAKQKRGMTRYFEAFYATLGNDAEFAREITGKCRK